ncbi:MAG: MerR family DNA-binding transcriptional regulator [Proteobacteria bacterium]|nr:MerR family DNA-binding transcriptional regulator [Pseudomonadota bacterium]MBS0572321.1 MerR family DNA-binding transcriptional regulator [Pseudomonadota bacterium]
MSDDLMGIRAMCEMFDLTPRTLRFYEQKDLLSPLREGQRRLYSRRDRARLKLILRGRRFGVSLEEIRELLDLYDLADQKHLQLPRTIELAERRLAEMRAQRDELDRAIVDLTDQIALARALPDPQDHDHPNAA